MQLFLSVCRRYLQRAGKCLQMEVVRFSKLMGVNKALNYLIADYERRRRSCARLSSGNILHANALDFNAR